MSFQQQNNLLVSDPILCDSLNLLDSMRELSTKVFELLGQLSEASSAAAASIPSPKAEEATDNVKTEASPDDDGEMKVDTSSESTRLVEAEFASSYKPLLAKTIRLKQLSRSHLLALRDAKINVTEKREEVDRLQLELQNMYYRQRYLKQEIEHCNDFR